MVVDSNMSYDEIERRIETRDHRNKTVRFVLWRRGVLWIMAGLAKVARHRQAKFCSKALGYRKEGGIPEGRSHVVIDIVDAETRSFCPFDLGSQLALDLAQIGVVLIKVVGGGKEKAVPVHERGNGGPA